ncbi:hypothetical protein V8C86DRAFT_604759 [Haematococcus lacustris]
MLERGVEANGGIEGMSVVGCVRLPAIQGSTIQPQDSSAILPDRRKQQYPHLSPSAAMPQLLSTGVPALKGVPTGRVSPAAPHTTLPGPLAPSHTVHTAPAATRPSPVMPADPPQPPGAAGAGGTLAAPAPALLSPPADPPRSRSPDRLNLIGPGLTLLKLQQQQQLAALAMSGAAANGGPRYAWDADMERMLRAKLLNGPGTGTGLMGALSLSPPSPDPSVEPSPAALAWFRAQYPEPPPTQRREAVAVASWVQEQLRTLQAAVDHSSGGGASSQPSPGPQPGPALAPQPSQQPSAAASSGNSSAPPTFRSHTISQPAAGHPGPPSTASPPRPRPCSLSDDGRLSVVVVRDAEGQLAAEVLGHQEQVLTRGMQELCGQVAALCVERGHAMWQLWMALRHMLRLTLQDREHARLAAREAQRSEAVARKASASQEAQLQAQMEELRAMNELLNRRVLVARNDTEVTRTQVSKLEAKVAELAQFNPEVLLQQVASLQDRLASTQQLNTHLGVKAEALQKELDASNRDVAVLGLRLSDTLAEASNLAADLAVRTPRPQQQRVPPWELISEEEAALAQQALREGCSALDMHRLLLGVSHTNCVILPWVQEHMVGPTDHTSHLVTPTLPHTSRYTVPHLTTPHRTTANEPALWRCGL